MSQSQGRHRRTRSTNGAWDEEFPRIGSTSPPADRAARDARSRAWKDRRTLPVAVGRGALIRSRAVSLVLLRLGAFLPRPCAVHLAANRHPSSVAAVADSCGMTCPSPKPPPLAGRASVLLSQAKTRETDRRQGCHAIGLGMERRGSQWGTESSQQEEGAGVTVGGGEAGRAMLDYAARRTSR
jgi:hypothetical protein